MALLLYVQKQLARQQRPKSVRAIKAGEAEEEEEKEGEDADMEDLGRSKKPQKSWEAFAGEGEDQEPEAEEKEEAAEPRAGRKRGRVDGGAAPGATAPKSREPPTSAAMSSDAVQALLDAWEAEGGSDDEGGKGKARAKRKRDSVAASSWIHEDRNVPLDFMSADAAHSVLTVRPPPAKRQRGVQVGWAGAENKVDALRRSGLRFAPDGRLVVEDVPETEGKEPEKKFTIGTDTKKLKPLSQLAAKRAARAKAKAVARVERRSAHVIKGLDSFKPGKKKAAGDVQRQGQSLKPYAYVKLNPKVTKEKFKDKAVKSFERVLKGAKNGILKGQKARAQQLKQKKAKEAKKQRKMKSSRPHKPNAR